MESPPLPNSHDRAGEHRRTVAILPAYNLERSVAEIVRRTKPFVHEVLVVADGSKDGTARAAREAGALVLEPDAVRGKGYAVIKGIELSKSLKADIVVLMDCDGQHLPEEIPNVVRPLLEGRADAVVGSRMLGTLRTSKVNRFGNFGLKVISFLVSGRWMTDTESGFRAFLAHKLYGLQLSSRGYEIESELFLRALHMGWRIVEVPINVPFAIPGVTVKDGLKVGWYKIRTGLRLRFGRRSA